MFSLLDACLQTTEIKKYNLPIYDTSVAFDAAYVSRTDSLLLI